MATVYSLVVWGGTAGKTVTSINAGTDVITLSNHGLITGMAVVPQSTVSGVTSGTTYYANAISTTTFYLYNTEANAIAGGATGRVDLTATTTFTLVSAYYLGLSDTSRWGTRIYAGIWAWKTARGAVCSPYDIEVCELGEAFWEATSVPWSSAGSAGTGDTQALTSAKNIIISKINGEVNEAGVYVGGTRTTAFHNGTQPTGVLASTNKGYIVNPQGISPAGGTLNLGRYRDTVDGFSIWTGSSGGLYYGVNSVFGQHTVNAMCVVYSAASGTVGIQVGGADGVISNNIVKVNGSTGISCVGNNRGTLVVNNLATGCNVGISSDVSTNYGFYYNNIALGNTTNWGASNLLNIEGASNNAGLSGEAWMIGTGAVRVTMATSDFANYASLDYRPAAVTSPQVETGAAPYGAPASDAEDNFRPSYSGSNYGTAVTAGSFVAGLSYTVATVGTTDYTLIGATNNAVTFTDAGDTVTWNAHPLSNGDIVYFSAITSTTGISTNTLYYVVGRATNTFQVATTANGSALPLTTNGSGTVVLTTFKATGVGTGTGTATLNAKYDIGPFEYDLGYGDWPNSVTVATSGMVDGSRISINKQSDGTEIRNELLSSETTDSFSYDTSSDIPVYIYLRKGSAATYYHPVKISATILADGGLTYDFTGLQNEDIAATTVTGNVATDWTINWSTGAITHASGATRYSVQNLYSFHQDESDSSTNIDATPKMHGTTPTIFELINDGSITDGDMEDLFGGSIERVNGDLFSNVYNVGTLTGTPTIYIYQGTNKLTTFWSAGDIDVLLKVSNAGTPISSGLVTGYARKWGYTYDHYQADLSGGGRNVMPLSTSADINITETTTTVGGWTDVTFTFGSTSKDFGDGDGAQTYYLVINCNNRPLSEVYQRAQYVCRESASGTLDGVAAETYQKAHSSYTANKAAPFGTYAGGTWTLAQGIWLDNVPSADSVNYILTDHAGNTHQNVITPGAASATVLAGSRVQLYNVDQATEIDNVVNADTSYSYAITTEAAEGETLRLRVCKLGYEPVEVFGVYNATAGVQFLVTQSSDAVYTAWGIDGSTVTEFTLDVTGNIEIDANDVDGATTKTRLGAWYNYALTTEDGIRSAFGAITYLATNSIRINVATVDLTVENVNATTALRFTDTDVRLYRSDGTTIIAATSYSIHNDYSGVPDVVETGVSGLTGPESAQLMGLTNAPSAATVASEVLTAAQSTPIYADIRKVNNTSVAGTGAVGDEWGPA